MDPEGKHSLHPNPITYLHLIIPSKKRININGHCKEEKSEKVKGMKGGKNKMRMVAPLYITEA